jgi:ribosomal protein S14
MKKYSIIKPDPSMKNNLMAFGFMCGKGWYPLIYETLDKIQAVVDRDGLDLEITEVKEKFGELRIYTSTYSEKIYKIIQKASEKSTQTCEICGQPGALIEINGWYMTRCEECLKSEQQ